MKKPSFSIINFLVWSGLILIPIWLLIVTAKFLAEWTLKFFDI